MELNQVKEIREKCAATRSENYWGGPFIMFSLCRIMMNQYDDIWRLYTVYCIYLYILYTVYIYIYICMCIGSLSLYIYTYIYKYWFDLICVKMCKVILSTLNTVLLHPWPETGRVGQAPRGAQRCGRRHPRVSLPPLLWGKGTRGGKKMKLELSKLQVMFITWWFWWTSPTISYNNSWTSPALKHFLNHLFVVHLFFEHDLENGVLTKRALDMTTGSGQASKAFSEFLKWRVQENIDHLRKAGTLCFHAVR